MKYLKYLVFFLFFIGCKQNNSSHEVYQQSTSSSSENESVDNQSVDKESNDEEPIDKESTKNESVDDESGTQLYKDGTWCADVEYYNPNTGTRHTYTLNVEVANGELTEIEWPNGGWLDESHFTAEDITSGECSFDSDKGNTYTVTLEYKGGCS